MKTNWLGCAHCVHYIPGTGNCAAFPKAIPMAIASGDMHHDRVLKGQTGDFVFTPKQSQ
jgi:hypothetical protein